MAQAKGLLPESRQGKDAALGEGRSFQDTRGLPTMRIPVGQPARQ